MNHNVSIWYAEHLLCHPQRGGTHRLRTTDLASWELKVCMFSLWSRSWSIGNVSVDARKRVKPVKYQTGQIWPLSQEWENQVLGFHLNFCIPTPWIPQKQTSNSAVYTLLQETGICFPWLVLLPLLWSLVTGLWKIRSVYTSMCSEA